MTTWQSTNSQYLVPPPVSTPYPSNWLSSSGYIYLFADASWSSRYFGLSTSAYTEGSMQSLVGSAHQDAVTWISFNLPVGTVATFVEHIVAPVPGQPYNFANAGRCVDLIGNGSLQTVDMTKIGANDCLSGFIWRKVDYAAGIFQLFNGPNWDSWGNTFFLSEWPANTAQSLVDWAICDQAASIYFGGLGVESVTLYDGAHGDGKSSQFAGWLTGVGGPNDKGVNLVQRGFNDITASWQWSPLRPVYQTVKPFTINSTVSVDDSLSMTLNSSGVNTGGSTVQQTAKFTYTISQQATLTVTDTSTATYTQTAGFTFGQTWGVVNIASGSYSVAMNVSFSEQFTETITETDTTTQTLASELDQLVSVPANSNWVTKLVLQYAKVPPTAFKTTGTYYYEQQVPGSVLDPAMAAQLGYEKLYVLTTTISGYVDARLSVNALSTVTTTPIGSSESTTTESTIDTIPVPVPVRELELID